MVTNTCCFGNDPLNSSLNFGEIVEFEFVSKLYGDLTLLSQFFNIPFQEG